MTALQDIAAERQRQIEVEGWAPEHDDEHSSGEMAKAAACYAVGSRHVHVENSPEAERGWRTWRVWPWSVEWWKPGDRRRDLVKAAALIVAEIERLDRARNP